MNLRNGKSVLYQPKVETEKLKPRSLRNGKTLTQEKFKSNVKQEDYDESQNSLVEAMTNLKLETDKQCVYCLLTSCVCINIEDTENETDEDTDEDSDSSFIVDDDEESEEESTEGSDEESTEGSEEESTEESDEESTEESYERNDCDEEKCHLCYDPLGFYGNLPNKDRENLIFMRDVRIPQRIELLKILKSPSEAQGEIECLDSLKHLITNHLPHIRVNDEEITANHGN
jgi:cobalamin biosynthesis protein CobT